MLRPLNKSFHYVPLRAGYHRQKARFPDDPQNQAHGASDFGGASLPRSNL